MKQYEAVRPDSPALEAATARPQWRDASASSPIPSEASRWTRLYGGWAVAGLLALHALRSRPSIVEGEGECWDPYAGTGYIHRPENGSIRWIPYPPSSSSLSLSASVELDSTLDPPPEAVALAAPAYGELLDRLDEESVERELSWARGKRVVFVGDSHDRSNVEAWCNRHRSAAAQTQLSVPHYHLKADCLVPSLNLTLSSWFHYGLAPESDSLPSPTSTNPSDRGWNIPALPTSRLNENPAPYSVEERMEAFWLPDVREVSKPDLIVLNSFFWDLRYFTLHAHHFRRPAPLREWLRPLSYNELAWHRARVREYVELFRREFPGVPLMFRLGQSRRDNAHHANVAVFQLNESLRAVLRELDVPVFEWARLITGESRYNDDQHLSPGQPAQLWGDMALHYLRKAVEGRWDVCEKPPRLR
ncbi:hypothetical protein JCM10207_006167 [Rhodosporidiobolus poonsookiae]